MASYLQCFTRDCMAFYNDSTQCGALYSPTITPEMLNCLCTPTVIADYTKCQPCLVTVPGNENTTISVDAYVTSCKNKDMGPVNPYNPSMPIPTSSGSGSLRPTTGPGSSTGGGGDSGSSNNTAMYAGIGAGHQQQQHQGYYPTVVAPPPVSQPAPSPTFPTTDPYYQQQQQQQQQVPHQPAPTTSATGEGIASVASAQHSTPDYHSPAASLSPMPMPGQSHSYSAFPSPTTTVMSGSVGQSTTVFEPSPAATATSTISKPIVSVHGPQFIEPVSTSVQPNRPANPQYVAPADSYHS
ncbi:hypothetical protein KVV02_006355 [Mortierella alpina]|uniref:Uncharacterized protein n=1 Tax=Mortierella alpina TaxID=64518 RepID=A0A9P8D382_MORAP|nr:hypothetical protein KVV02_006355 [Mortierella alpina]